MNKCYYYHFLIIPTKNPQFKKNRISYSALPNQLSDLYRKIEMGIVGSIFELHPPNFQKMCIFWRFTNDISTIFCYLLWFQFWKKCQSLPVHPRVVPGQPYDLDSLVLLNLYSTFYIRKSEYTLVLITLMISHMVSQWAQMEEVSTMPWDWF